MYIHKRSHIFHNILQTSPSLKKIVELAKKVAPMSTSLMIVGETGTGKEVIARGIHELSGRKGMFVPVTLSAVTQELFEAEVFGYVAGSFTGANKKGKTGFLEMSNGGTLLLDEIGDMPLNGQVKLLRVLQEREYVKVGDDKYSKLDLRVIAATNKPLAELIAEGKFRMDLFYRLNVFEIALPPLRERQEDIPLLLEKFIETQAEKNALTPKKVHPDLLCFLQDYSWPGNIRELMNVAEYLLISSEHPHWLTLENLPEHMLYSRSQRATKQITSDLNLKQAVQTLEIDYIRKALIRCDNNKVKAAAMLNIPRATLYKKMSDYGVE